MISLLISSLLLNNLYWEWWAFSEKRFLLVCMSIAPHLYCVLWFPSSQKGSWYVSLWTYIIPSEKVLFFHILSCLDLYAKPVSWVAFQIATCLFYLSLMLTVSVQFRDARVIMNFPLSLFPSSLITEVLPQMFSCLSQTLFLFLKMSNFLFKL